MNALVGTSIASSALPIPSTDPQDSRSPPDVTTPAPKVRSRLAYHPTILRPPLQLWDMRLLSISPLSPPAPPTPISTFRTPAPGPALTPSPHPPTPVVGHAAARHRRLLGGSPTHPAKASGEQPQSAHLPPFPYFPPPHTSCSLPPSLPLPPATPSYSEGPRRATHPFSLIYLLPSPPSPFCTSLPRPPPLPLSSSSEGLRRATAAQRSPSLPRSPASRALSPNNQTALRPPHTLRRYRRRRRGTCCPHPHSSPACRPARPPARPPALARPPSTFALSPAALTPLPSSQPPPPARALPHAPPPRRYCRPTPTLTNIAWRSCARARPARSDVGPLAGGGARVRCERLGLECSDWRLEIGQLSGHRACARARVVAAHGSVAAGGCATQSSEGEDDLVFANLFTGHVKGARCFLFRSSCHVSPRRRSSQERDLSSCIAYLVAY
jgi:hypothetical protein